MWRLLEFSEKILSLEKTLSLDCLEFGENRWKKKPDLLTHVKFKKSQRSLIQIKWRLLTVVSFSGPYIGWKLTLISEEEIHWQRWVNSLRLIVFSVKIEKLALQGVCSISISLKFKFGNEIIMDRLYLWMYIFSINFSRSDWSRNVTFLAFSLNWVKWLSTSSSVSTFSNTRQR